MSNIKSGDILVVKKTGERVTVQSRGTSEHLSWYLDNGKVPFRYEKFNYTGFNCHSHLFLSDFRKLTKLEKALK